jgi:MSHA pilin protein MshA
MKRQAGFTLIELVMVIVILGILSAFALPRFADLGTEARAASLNGALGAVKAASSIAHASFLVTGVAPVELEGTSIAMSNGYPTASETLGIALAAQIVEDFDLSLSGTILTVAAIGATGTCEFTYTAAVAADAAASPPVAASASVVSVADVSGC